MNLQYVFDKKGLTTGVIIPISEWEALKMKYVEIEQEEDLPSDIPEWHKTIIDQRLAEIKRNPETMVDFDEAFDEIEKEL